MARQLLIMPCSATKSPAECAIKAAERYTGSLWQTLNTTLGHEDAVKSLNNIGVDLYVLSAKHGLISADELIEDYDQRMTKDRQLEILGDEKLSTNIRNVLKNYPEEAVYLGGLGKDYKKLIENVMGKEYPQDKNSRLPRGIGDKRKALKDWLQAYMASKAIETILPAESTPDMMNIPDWLRKGMATLRKGAPIVSFLEAAVHDYKDLPEDKKKEIEGVVEDILDPVKRGLGSFTTLFQQEESPPPGPETNVQDNTEEDLSEQMPQNEGTGIETEYDEYLKLLESAPTEVEVDAEYEKYLKLLEKGPSEIMDQEVWEATFESFRKALDVDHFPSEGTSLNIPPSQERIDLYNALKLQQPSPTEATLQTGSLSWYNDPEEGYNLLAPPMSFEKFLGWKYPGVELVDLMVADKFKEDSGVVDEGPGITKAQGGFVDKPLYDRDRSYYG